MKPSVKHYIFRQFFSISILTVVSLVVLVELLSSDLEKNMMALEIKHEKAHYQPLSHDDAMAWKTAGTTAVYVPDHIKNFAYVPSLFHDLTIPFSGEIEEADRDYWVDISRTPKGILYIARDTTLFDQREKVFFVGVIIVGVIFIIISFFLSQISARRITKPLYKLIGDIGSITPEDKALRISENYRDHELYSIAKTFNGYLDIMGNHVKREQLLISMASHELRTPVAVISGALDVLDHRGTLSLEDRKTIGRIRDATNEMNANIEAILMLARKRPASVKKRQVILNEILLSTVQERLDMRPEDQSRLNIVSDDFNHVINSDATLIKMLLRNIIQNALDHTQGTVTLLQNKHGLLITDEGAGLPRDVKSRIFHNQSLYHDKINKSGMGLFIVALICEHLGWSMSIDDSVSTGTRIQFHFVKEPLE